MKMQPTFKGKFVIRRGCLALVLSVIVILMACYGFIWLFARYGGEWADSFDSAIPENSRLLMVTYEFDRYTLKDSLYLHAESPEQVREWFTGKGIALTPIDMGTSVVDNDDYYLTIGPISRGSSWEQLHDFSARYTAGWWDDFTETCDAVRVYKRLDAARQDFPTALVPDGGTAFVITSCWPGVVR